MVNIQSLSCRLWHGTSTRSPHANPQGGGRQGGGQQSGGRQRSGQQPSGPRPGASACCWQQAMFSSGSNGSTSSKQAAAAAQATSAARCGAVASACLLCRQRAGTQPIDFRGRDSQFSLFRTSYATLAFSSLRVVRGQRAGPAPVRAPFQH